MKRLGIDYGSKKIGIAVTDDAGIMAFPLSVVSNDQTFLAHLERLVAERGVEEIVIGHSLDLVGKENAIHAAVEDLITDITLHIGIPVQLEPEQYTTQQAVREQGRNGQTDASAAALILNGFINKRNK